MRSKAHQILHQTYSKTGTCSNHNLAKSMPNKSWLQPCQTCSMHPNIPSYTCIKPCQNMPWIENYTTSIPRNMSKKDQVRSKTMQTIIQYLTNTNSRQTQTCCKFRINLQDLCISQAKPWPDCIVNPNSTIGKLTSYAISQNETTTSQTNGFTIQSKLVIMHLYTIPTCHDAPETQQLDPLPWLNELPAMQNCSRREIIVNT